MIKQLYLIRLLKHSKPAFLFVAVFLLFYAVTSYKKMDMIFFPYNNMYAIDFTGSTVSATYAMKVNGNRLNITGNTYWKKDILETSLNGYCRYLQHNNRVFLDDYLEYRFSNLKLRTFLTDRLIPEKEQAERWPEWFAARAGYPVKQGDEITFMKYRIRLDKDQAVILDSTQILNTRIP